MCPRSSAALRWQPIWVAGTDQTSTVGHPPDAWAKLFWISKLEALLLIAEAGCRQAADIEMGEPNFLGRGIVGLLVLLQLFSHSVYSQPVKVISMQMYECKIASLMKGCHFFFQMNASTRHLSF